MPHPSSLQTGPCCSAADISNPCIADMNTWLKRFCIPWCLTAVTSLAGTAAQTMTSAYSLYHSLCHWGVWLPPWTRLTAEMAADKWTNVSLELRVSGSRLVHMYNVHTRQVCVLTVSLLVYDSRSFSEVVKSSAGTGLGGRGGRKTTESAVCCKHKMSCLSIWVEYYAHVL